MEDKKQPKFVGIIALLIAIGVIGLMAYAFLSPIVIGITYSVDKSYIYLTGEKTPGTIINYDTVGHTQRGGNVTYTYIPQVQFTTSKGNVVTVASNLNESDNMVVPVGSVENIRYEVSNPTKFIITNSELMASSNMFSINAGLYILSFICIGLVIASAGRNKSSGRTKKRLIFLGTVIVILTGVIIYEYVNIGISISLIMSTSLLFVNLFLGIFCFKRLLDGDNGMKN